jgi:hypothetical protein
MTVLKATKVEITLKLGSTLFQGGKIEMTWVEMFRELFIFKT